MADTTSAAFFDAKYRAAADPWQFESNPYELSRYDAILQALQDRRYSHAWEPGCSVGVLTERLAQMCDSVDACDLSSTAVQQAKSRCAHLPGVHVRCASFADGTAFSSTDLVVLSEIGYYFTATQWQQHVAALVAQLPTGATVLASHWLGTSPDHLEHGDTVHGVLMEQAGLQHEHGERHTAAEGGFRLDRWRRI